MVNLSFGADPNNKDIEYTPDLNFYQPDLHDLSEGSESLDESLRMKEQPFMGTGRESEREETQ